MKKKILIILLSAVCLVGCGKSSASTATEAATTTQLAIESETSETPTESTADDSSAVETTTDETTEESSESETALKITLTAGEPNIYSDYIVFNADTEDEIIRLVYYVPVGTYDVKNIGSYMSQVNVYSTAKNISNGFEEPLNASTYTVDVGDTTEIEIPTDYYIYISEPTEIELTLK